MTKKAYLAKAAVRVFERIHQDKARAGERTLPLLECLEANLFSPACNVNFLKRSTGTRDNSAVSDFHRDLGITPKTYLETCRMEVAARLLLDSTLKIWKIGDLLGYSSIGVFSRSFSRWAGMPASVYRKSHGVVRASTPPSGHMQPTMSDLTRAMTGDLEPDEAVALIAHLRTLYPANQRCLVAA